jgi:hypothetical protein
MSASNNRIYEKDISASEYQIVSPQQSLQPHFRYVFPLTASREMVRMQCIPVPTGLPEREWQK